MSLQLFPFAFVIIFVILILYLLSSVKVLAEYERAVVFRLGRVLSTPKGPGVIFVFSPLDRMVRRQNRRRLSAHKGLTCQPPTSAANLACSL